MDEGEPAPRTPLPGLTDLLTLVDNTAAGEVACGCGRRGRIAARPFVSPATAKTHVSRAMTKVGARLVVLAHQTGLVSPAG